MGFSPTTCSLEKNAAETVVRPHREVKVVKTEYGSVTVYLAKDGSYYLLPRHGLEHGVPPHMVNYRANISSLYWLGVKGVIATSAVGSMNPKFKVGQLGLVGQFLDFTRRRPQTFFDEEVKHTDMTNPYSSKLNEAMSRAGRTLGLRVSPNLVYVCVEGPRFETAAEIRMFRLMGGDVVGMTGVPEVVLANELGLEYCSVAIATNWAAGMQNKVSHAEVLEGMRKTGPKVKTLIVAAMRLLGEEQR